MDERDRTFCQNLLKDIMVLKSVYSELCKNMEAAETAFRRRFGGMANIGNPELSQRIYTLWNALSEKFNEKSKESRDETDHD
jgi:CRISPR/Cas system-associated protein endoribonuclease Cas2